MSSDLDPLHAAHDGWGPLALYTADGRAVAESAPGSDEPALGAPGELTTHGRIAAAEQWSATTYSGPRRHRPDRGGRRAAPAAQPAFDTALDPALDSGFDPSLDTALNSSLDTVMDPALDLDRVSTRASTRRRRPRPRRTVPVATPTGACSAAAAPWRSPASPAG